MSLQPMSQIFYAPESGKITQCAPAISDTARPNCLPTQSDVGNDFVGEEVLISGWGRLSDSAGSIATYLNYVDGVPIISQQECEAVYGSLNEGVICIDTAGGRGSCNVRPTILVENTAFCSKLILG